MATMQADAVVVTANEDLQITGGIGAAVAQAAGMRRLQEACDAAAPCPVGHAVVTPGYAHPARMIVHAVGPVWDDPSLSDVQKRHLLLSAYESALRCAFDRGARSIGLPLISAGSFGCPPAISFALAMEAVRAFLVDHEALVVLVVYDREAVSAAVAIHGQIAEYIDDRYVGAQEHERRACFRERGASSRGEQGRRLGSLGSVPPRSASDTAPTGWKASPAATDPLPPACSEASHPTDLSQWLDGIDASFSETLLRLIDERGLSDAEVYKRANMSRQLFSRIRCDADYRPSKKTVLALSIALELSLRETSDLLMRAGFALSHSSVADLVVEFFIVRGQYDIFAINEALYAFDQQLL